MARVRIAKATSGSAFVSKKKACEARLAAQEAGEEVEPYDDIFELQHHHLLRCLEKATVSSSPLPEDQPKPGASSTTNSEAQPTQDREFVEQELVEAQLSQQANADSQAQALSLSKKLLSAAKGTKSTTRGCLHSCCQLGRRSRYSRQTAAGSGPIEQTELELGDIEGRGSGGAGKGRQQVAQSSLRQRQTSAAEREQPAPSTSRWPPAGEQRPQQ